jgi:hypothetical protein
MQNLIVHITLPKTLKLASGAALGQDVTFDVVSSLTPYYASIDQIRLYGGMYIRKLSDLTLAASIYSSSQEADLLTSQCSLDAGSSVFKMYAGSRNQWVTAKAARNLILNLMGLVGMPGAHVLANFSVTRQRGLDDEGVAARLRGINQDIALYEPVLRSCGTVVPGGHPKPGFAAKGVFDYSERTPGRTWINTGIGTNAKSMDYGSPTGGRGKPVGFYASSFYSPPIISFRTGIYQGAYPLIPARSYPGGF